jgi:hypothetical protein
MNGSVASVSLRDDDVSELPAAPAAFDSVTEAAKFLEATAKVLHETVQQFEQTVGRITDQVMNRSSDTDRNLIVALQDFDRLQQQFSGLGNVILHLASAPKGAWSQDGEHPGWRAISEISISNLRDQFMRHLDYGDLREDGTRGGDETEF